MQRRHQGLPLHPLFNSKNQIMHQNQSAFGLGVPIDSSNPIKSVSSATQTETEAQPTKAKEESQINLQTVSDFVEKYLQQKAEENRLPSPTKTDIEELKSTLIEEMHVRKHIGALLKNVSY